MNLKHSWSSNDMLQNQNNLYRKLSENAEPWQCKGDDCWNFLWRMGTKPGPKKAFHSDWESLIMKEEHNPRTTSHFSLNFRVSITKILGEYPPIHECFRKFQIELSFFQLCNSKSVTNLLSILYVTGWKCDSVKWRKNKELISIIYIFLNYWQLIRSYSLNWLYWSYKTIDAFVRI
jgi:hypothetical protein